MMDHALLSGCVRQVGVNKLETAFDSNVVWGRNAVVCTKAGQLVPNFQETIPWSGGHGHAIFCNAQTTDAVVVTC